MTYFPTLVCTLARHSRSHTLARHGNHTRARSKNNRRLPAPAVPFPRKTESRTHIENRNSPPILRPARNVVTDGNWTFFAIRERAHAVRPDTTRRKVVTYRLGAPG